MLMSKWVSANIPMVSPFACELCPLLSLNVVGMPSIFWKFSSSDSLKFTCARFPFMEIVRNFLITRLKKTVYKINHFPSRGEWANVFIILSNSCEWK